MRVYSGFQGAQSVSDLKDDEKLTKYKQQGKKNFERNYPKVYGFQQHNLKSDLSAPNIKI